MKRHFLRLGGAILLVPASVSLAGAQAKQEAKEVLKGDTIQVTTTSDLNTAGTITVTLSPEEKCTCKEPVRITINSPAKNGFSLGIPLSTCPGPYEMGATQDPPPDKTKSTEVNLTLQHIIVKEIPPVVTGIDPTGFYQGDPKSFVILGPSSLLGAETYTIRFAKHALLQCTNDGEPTKDEDSCVKSEPSENGQIKFSLHGPDPVKKWAGKQSVVLIHNGAESKPLDFTLVSETREAPRNYALGVSIAIVVLIYLLLSAGHQALKGHKGNFLLTALFLDEETQTYSLSKCQFYAWTFAAILGYVFLAVAKSKIQGSAEFPDIPDGLPGILLFSAGTSVAAIGITSSKGSKGSGAVHPTLADFITSGGVVAPERLQFVVWTIVGIFTFLTIVFLSDPLSVSTLPKIPPGFLQLMGISSAGYLGGKLARKAGPVVKTVAVADTTLKGETLPDKYRPKAEPVLPAKVEQSVLTLNLQGENLDPKAKVKVDGQPLRGDLFWITGATPDPQTGFCTEINLSLSDAETYLSGTHTLTLANSDSQASDVAFPVDRMTIDSVDLTAAGAATVTGKNFAPKTKYQWRDEKSNLVNDQGQLVDAKGRRVSDKGQLVDAKGRRVNDQGQLINDQGQFVDQQDNVVQVGAAVTVTPATSVASDYTPFAVVESTTKLTVKAPPKAAAGSGYTLTLISPVGLRASRQI